MTTKREVIRHKADKCSKCSWILDAASEITNRGGFINPGDFSICFRCGNLMVFETGLTLRHPTATEVAEAQRDPKIVAAMDIGKSNAKR